MLKKVLPIIILSGVLLVGCNNNGADQKNNAMPKEDLRNDIERDIEGNGSNIKGNENHDGMNNVENPGDNIMIEEAGDKSQVEKIEDFNRKNNVE